MPQYVVIEHSDGVATVRLNRPEKMNALNMAMFEALSEASAHLSGLQGLRAVVLTGEGRGFCAGIDLELLNSQSALQDLKTRTHGIANIFQNAVLGWRYLPVPVIAAVHGVAFGGGFQIMLGADMRIMAPDTKLAVMEARWGLIPDMAGTLLLPGLVRDDVARELTYSARQFDGIEAERLGLATRLDERPLEAALELARQIAATSPRAIRSAKRLFNLVQDARAEEQLIAEAGEQQAHLQGSDHRETLKAAFEQRPARFED